MLDAFPDHATGLLATITAASGLSKVVCKQTLYNDSILSVASSSCRPLTPLVTTDTGTHIRTGATFAAI
jgi:hypothetical protein